MSGDIRRGSSARRAVLAAGIGAACLVILASGTAGARVGIGGVWLIDEGGGQTVKDSSGNANPGVLGSTTGVDANDPQWVAGATRRTKALRFDGNDYVKVRDSPSLESERITVGAVIRASGSPGAYRYVVSKGAFMCESASYGLYTGASGALQFYVSNSESFTLSPAADLGIWDNRWHIVAGTFDGTVVRLYVDGVEVGGGTPSTLVPRYGLPDDDNFYIGDYRGPCGSTMLGFVGDIEVVGLLNDVVNWRPW